MNYLKHIKKLGSKTSKILLFVILMFATSCEKVLDIKLKVSNNDIFIVFQKTKVQYLEVIRYEPDERNETIYSIKCDEMKCNEMSERTEIKIGESFTICESDFTGEFTTGKYIIGMIDCNHLYYLAYYKIDNENGKIIISKLDSKY